MKSVGGAFSGTRRNGRENSLVFLSTGRSHPADLIPAPEAIPEENALQMKRTRPDTN